MQITKTLATAALTASLAFGGAGIAQAATNQNAGAVGGLVAAAVNADRTVDIDQIQLVNVNGDVLSNIDVDVPVNNVLNGITVNALNDNEIDVEDVLDVTVVDNVLVVVVDVL
ncbi:hypothetical protein FDW83_11355 [Pseudarthrobacter sp. NamE2]|uniref:hypothetical protein n=1 Tax=Pseudarthrobacter sp. NamE2 TaxID=2576838 RepID=UPI0010FE62F2|nr:hypothetical protein [Pseudarthrobacter sp. NamE2]TLM82981.1 hypothetical protein FDW83_11355 [Pseudarthrobacter sp. NamE2]